MDAIKAGNLKFKGIIICPNETVEEKNFCRKLAGYIKSGCITFRVNKINKLIFYRNEKASGSLKPIYEIELNPNAAAMIKAYMSHPKTIIHVEPLFLTGTCKILFENDRVREKIKQSARK